MSTQQAKPLHLLPALHLIVVVTIGIWWGVFFWHHSPVREVLADGPRPAAQADRRGGTDPLASTSSLSGGKLLVAVRVAGPDLILGLSVLLLFGVASGVHVRRIDNWLHARVSGDAVALRGRDLTAATIDANKKEQRGILR